MEERSQLLRQLPKMDNLLEQAMEDPRFRGQPRNAVGDALRHCLEEARQAILAGRAADGSGAGLLEAAYARLRQEQTPNQRLIINGTGVILHTNLGRALLAPEAVEAAARVAGAYSTLEFDCATGKRGDRYLHVETILKELLGVEAALVVNNNAAAVMLALTAMARGREVVVSRGELVEIGGSFRIPEIVSQCGCRLREVGSTNKTHLRDYQDAVTPDTRAILQVHPSNYRIVGFTESVPLGELADLAHAHSLPVVADLGSGCLVDLASLGIPGEPTVACQVAAGADLVTFSGDKLLGGPQAGLLVGRTQWIEPLKRHPLARALRVDKLTLAALEATLRAYRDPRQALQEIPTLRMLTLSAGELRRRAETLAGLLAELQVQIIPVEDVAGGGSLPGQTLPGYAVALMPPAGRPAAELERRLRAPERPVLCRVQRDRCLFHLRTVWEEDLPALAASIREAAL